MRWQQLIGSGLGLVWLGGGNNASRVIIVSSRKKKQSRERGDNIGDSRSTFLKVNLSF